MNIEIANRLVNLRKANNYSQEVLAEKLGISRQAVSKWERAEASPDTDNLIMLARLYGVSLDELLFTEDEISRPEPDEEAGRTDRGSANNEDTNQNDETNKYEETNKKEEYVHVGFNGVHVRDKDGSEVHVGWDGIHIDDRDNIHIDKNGVFVNGEKYDNEWFKQYHRQKFPMVLLITIGYILLGFFYNLWHSGWILFLLIPIWYSFVEAVYKKNAHLFAYPVFTTLAFLMLGFFGGHWHPGWAVFLTVPLYYSLVSYFRGDGSKEESEGKGDGLMNNSSKIWVGGVAFIILTIVICAIIVRFSSGGADVSVGSGNITVNYFTCLVDFIAARC